MSQLRSLIRKIRNDKGARQVIRHPRLLELVLEELDGMIGNDTVKESIASQTAYLIREKAMNRGNKAMLNTIFYGPPGVGKTRLGTVLAKIWFALGFIPGSKNARPPRDAETPGETEDGEDIGKLLRQLMGGVGDGKDESGLLMIALIFVIFIWGMSTMARISESLGKNLTLWVFGIAIFILGIYLIYYYFTVYRPTKLYRNDEDIFVGPEPSVTRSNASDSRDENKSQVKDQYDRLASNVVNIVSREDFVGMYAGWTTKKTMDVIRNSKGKALFVDEAYSLDEGPFDTFGAEAATTLTRYLSEHPEFVCIMAGYKDKLQSGLFKKQPGLPRRFMWHFDCPGYTVDELFEIFKIQLESFTLEDNNGCRRIFRNNSNIFPSYAGDTEKLAFFAKMEHSKSLSRNDIITTSELRRAVDLLRENNVDQSSKSDVSSQDMLSSLLSGGNPDVLRKRFESLPA